MAASWSRVPLPRLVAAALGAAAALAVGEGVARLQGDHLCPATPGAVYQADPRVGWTHVPHLAGWIGGCPGSPLPAVAATANAAGLLDAERPYEKPPGTVRILVLGGNLPEALGVLRERGVARILEKLADRRRGRALEVINAGTGGFALDNDLLYLRHEGLRFRPDVVLVVIDPTFDATAVSPALLRAEGRPVPAKPFFTLADGQLVPAAIERPVPPPAADAAPRGLLARSQLYRRLAGLPARTGPPFAFLPAGKPWQGNIEAERALARELSRELLEAMRDEVAAAGARLVAVVAPGPPPAAVFRAGRDFVRMTTALGIPTADLGPAFVWLRTNYRRTGYLPHMARWNDEGHHLASHAIWGFLEREALLPGVVRVRAPEGGRVAPDLRALPRALVAALFDGRHTALSRWVQFGLLAVSLVWMGAVLSPDGRDWLVVAVSVALVGVLGTPRLALAALGFAVLFWAVVEWLPRWASGTVVPLLLVAVVLVPVVWPASRATGGHALEAHQFFAAATGMALFRLVAYAHDRRSRGVPRRPLREFLAAMFFFPTFPYGPVETTEAFAAGRPAGGIAPPSFAALGAQLRVAGRSAARLVWGALKLQGATLALGTITPDVYATGGEAVGHLRLWAWTAELSLFFYLTVSGLNDVAIALGAMAGSTVTENFRAPWAATGPGDFWRRWNVALGRWLRDYVYIPLGGNRRRAPLNVLVVFLVSALWHAWGTLKLFGPTAYPPKAWGGFLLWGLVGAAGVMIAHRWPARDGAATPRSALRALWGRAWRFAATFAVVSVGWIAFFLPPWEELGDVGRILLRLLFVPGQGAS